MFKARFTSKCAIPNFRGPSFEIFTISEEPLIWRGSPKNSIFFIKVNILKLSNFQVLVLKMDEGLGYRRKYCIAKD